MCIEEGTKMPNDTTAGRLKMIMDEMGLRQIDLLERYNRVSRQYGEKEIGKSAISQYLNGKVLPKQDKLFILGEVLGVEPTWLMGYDVPRERPDQTAITTNDSIHPKRIPHFEKCAAGEPIFAEGSADYYMESPFQNADMAITVEGNSMYPDFKSGDIIYVKQQDDVNDGQIGVILIDGSATLKRIHHIKNGIELTSINPDYAPMIKTFSECDCIRIIGVPVGFTRKLV